MRIRIGTRPSKLARAQAERVAQMLSVHGHLTEVMAIRTLGDEQPDRPISEIGERGVFVRGIERALLEHRIDLAVHSYKDLPSTGPGELMVAAVPERLDPADRLLARPEAVADGLPTATGDCASGAVIDADRPSEPSDSTIPLRQGAVVGTSSPRRQALLNAARPDLQIRPLRGNVPTRLEKLRSGDYDAVILAEAGLLRLAQMSQATSDRPREDLVHRQAVGDDRDRATGPPALYGRRLDPSVFVPAPAQGALALQVRRDQAELRAILRQVHDRDAGCPVQAERRLLALVEGGCQVPFGAWCHSRKDGRLEMVAVLEVKHRLVTATGLGTDPEELAMAVWEKLRPTARPAVRSAGESGERHAR